MIDLGFILSTNIENSDKEECQNNYENLNMFFINYPLNSINFISKKDSSKKNHKEFRNELLQDLKIKYLDFYDSLNEDMKKYYQKIIEEDSSDECSISQQLLNLAELLNKRAYGENIYKFEQRIKKISIERSFRIYTYISYFYLLKNITQKIRLQILQYFHNITRHSLCKSENTNNFTRNIHKFTDNTDNFTENTDNLTDDTDNLTDNTDNLTRNIHKFTDNFISKELLHFLKMRIDKPLIEIIPQCTEGVAMNLFFIENLLENMKTDIEMIFLCSIEVTHFNPRFNTVKNNIFDLKHRLSQIEAQKVYFKILLQEKEDWLFLNQNDLQEIKKQIGNINFIISFINKNSINSILEEDESEKENEFELQLQEIEKMLEYFLENDIQKIKNICTAFKNIFSGTYTHFDLLKIDSLKEIFETDKKLLENGEKYKSEANKLIKTIIHLEKDEELCQLKLKEAISHLKLCIVEDILLLQYLEKKTVDSSAGKKCLCTVKFTPFVLSPEYLETLKKDLPLTSKDFQKFYKTFYEEKIHRNSFDFLDNLSVTN